MSGANPHRGEVALTLCEREITLRPTFAALVAIERETGIGLLALGRKLGQGSIEHVPTIIREGARAAGYEVQIEEIVAECTAHGALPFLNAAGQLIWNGIDGGAERKNAAAAEAGTR
jgi:hypothetical protein